MPYFPDLVRAREHLWLYVGDDDGRPMFRYADDLSPDATVEARDERRAQFRPGTVGGVPFATLAADATGGGGLRSLAGNDVMLDTEGRLYLWARRRSGESGVSAWWQVAPEDADSYRATRDRALSSGEYLVHITSRAEWERHGVSEHGPVTFTEPEPSIDPVPAPEQRSSAAYYLAPATTTTGASYARDSVTFTANSITLTALATVTPVHEPPAEAVLVADGGYVLVPAGTRGDDPMWRPFNMATSTWTQIRDRHFDAHRARTTGRGGGNRDTFAGWSRRFPTVRVLTPADLPPDLRDGRGRTWLHVGWHEGPRYRLGPVLMRTVEMERRNLMASCPESGFNVGRAWTRDRIERAHGGVTERPRRALPDVLVGHGETAVAPGQGVAPATVQHRDGNPRNNEVGNLAASGAMTAEPDPVAKALAELAAAEQTASAYREQVRARAIRGYTSDREYPSPAAVNISLRNLNLPEYKVKYRAQVIVEFEVETDDREEARRMAMRMATPLSGVTPVEGVAGSITARLDYMEQVGR